MNTHADKTQENKSQSVSALDSQMQSDGESTFQFVDNRPEAVAQRKLQEMANNSPRVSQLKAFQDMANNSPQAKQTAQLQAMADNYSASQQQSIQKKGNNTGLPDSLKTGMENLSGMSLDDVKVYRNSDKPAQLQAHAYAQGADIHLGPGQEKHLPHEAWHVVQQKQGRVKSTMQMKGEMDVNDDAGLEKEADVMGAKASQHNSNQSTNKEIKGNESSVPIPRDRISIQAKWISKTSLETIGGGKDKKAYWVPDAVEKKGDASSIPLAPPLNGPNPQEQNIDDSTRKKGWWIGEDNAQGEFTPIKPLTNGIDTHDANKESNAKGNIPAWAGSNATKVWNRDITKGKNEDEKKELRASYMAAEPLVRQGGYSDEYKAMMREASINRVLKSNREEMAIRLLLSTQNLKEASELIKGNLRVREDASTQVPLGTRQTAPDAKGDPVVPGTIEIDNGSKLNYQNANPGQTLTGVLRLKDLEGGAAKVYLYPNQAVDGYAPIGYKKYKPVNKKSMDHGLGVPSIGDMTILEFIAKLKELEFIDDAESWETSTMGKPDKGFTIEHTPKGTLSSHAQLTNLIDQLEQVANRTEKAGVVEADNMDEDDSREQLEDTELQSKQRIVGFTLLRGGMHTSNKFLFTSAGSNSRLFQGKGDDGESTFSVNAAFEAAIKKVIQDYDQELTENRGGRQEIDNVLRRIGPDEKQE
jgi:hypothetical protein